MRVTAHRSLFVERAICDRASMANDLPISSRERTDELGSLTLLFAGVLTVMGVLTLGVLRVAAAADERARAQSAADAAALAGASDGEAAARRIAVANTAELVQFEETARVGSDPQGRDLVDVFVEVHLGEAVAMATARRAVVPWNSEVATDGDGEFWNPTTTTSSSTSSSTTSVPTEIPISRESLATVSPSSSTTIQRARTTTIAPPNRTTIVATTTRIPSIGPSTATTTSRSR